MIKSKMKKVILASALAIITVIPVTSGAATLSRNKNLSSPYTSYFQDNTTSTGSNALGWGLFNYTDEAILIVTNSNNRIRETEREYTFSKPWWSFWDVKAQNGKYYSKSNNEARYAAGAIVGIGVNISGKVNISSYGSIEISGINIGQTSKMQYKSVYNTGSTSANLNYGYEMKIY